MIENAKNVATTPQVFYGLHMLCGAAEYRPPDADPFRVFLNEKTTKDMDASFRGKPLYVGHAQGKENLNEADGWVVKSFYCEEDGKHWAEFIAVSEEAKNAIKNGLKLSNAYSPKAFGSSGLYNGIEYQKEITEAEYDHLALVPDPRYAESIILTPEKFKQYREQKKMELAQLANSLEPQPNGGDTMAFWKKTKVENSLELESTMVDLPKSKTQVDLKTLINEMDDYRLEMKLPRMANDEDHVKMGEGESERQMSVKELKDCYNAMMDEKKKNESEKEEEEKAKEEPEKKAMNETSEEKEKKAPEEEKKKEMKAENEKEEDEKMKNQLKLFNELKNAHLNPIKEERTPDLGNDRLIRGKTRYGSN